MPDPRTDCRGGCREWSAAAFLLVAVAVALAVVNVWFGPLNQDEGWYLLAARNVGRGMLPYRDFFYTQGPALPFAYALFLPLWSPFGVLGGRVLTAVFGLLAAILASAFAFRVAGGGTSGRIATARAAALLVAALLCLSPDWAYFSVIPKTYSLGAFHLCFGALMCAVSADASASRRRAVAAAVLSGAGFALAAASRATLCLAALPFFAALLLDRRSLPLRRRVAVSAAFAAGCAAALVAVFVPSAGVAPDNFLFSQTYHVARASAPLGKWIVLRAAFLCFLAQGYPAMVCAAALLCLRPGARCATAGREPERAAAADAPNPLPLVRHAPLAAFALITAAHFLVPFPYADYNTPAMPFAAIALALPLASRAAAAGLRPLRAVAVAAAVGVVFVAASPWPMKWVGGRQDRFWFSFEGRSALSRLREAGRVVRELAGGDDVPVLTQDAYLAVEAGLPVVPGLEMGPFGFFPDLSDEEADRRNVRNARTMLAAIQSGEAPVAALSGYSFAVACPSTDPVEDETRRALLDAVKRRYPNEAFSMERFGQQDTALSVRTR